MKKTLPKMKMTKLQLFTPFIILLLPLCSIAQDDPKSINPNNPNASITLSWFDNTSRLRIGGSGIGSDNGFYIQGIGDKKLFKVVDGFATVYNPANREASVALSWLNNTARIRIGGSGTGSDNGFYIQGRSDKNLFKVEDGFATVFNPANREAILALSWLNSTARIRVGGSGEGASNGFEIQSTGDKKLFKVTHEGNAAIYGKLEAKEVKVTNAPTADFVFEEDYQLREIKEVEAYVKANKHLPDFPSGEEMKANGSDLAEMDALLLQKIEELTLYVIELKKENEKQNEIISEQSNVIEKLIKDK